MTQANISDLKLSDLLEAAQALTAPKVEVEVPPPFRWAWCRFCKRYFEEEPGKADCPICEREMVVRQETESELGRQYARALLLVQPLMGHETAGVELMERLDSAQSWTAPTNPMFFGNASNGQIRKAINALRGIAARYGLATGGVDPSIGQEIEIELRGEKWLAFEDAAGALRPIRRVPVVAEENAAMPAVMAEDEAPKGLFCPEPGCAHPPFKNLFALTAHQRTHGK